VKKAYTDKHPVDGANGSTHIEPVPHDGTAPAFDDQPIGAIEQAGGFKPIPQMSHRFIPSMKIHARNPRTNRVMTPIHESNHRLPRRQLLAAGAASIAGLAVLSRSPRGMANTMHARGSTRSDAIRVGCIGTGGRCRHLMRELAQVPGVSIDAICDVWDRALAEARPLARSGALETKDHRALLDAPLDAILIGAPDHWHVPLTIQAVEAGKHVYVEKPLTHDPAEATSVLEAVKASGKAVQVGMQQRSMPHIIEARKLIQSGAIGDVMKVHMSWNRNTDRIRRFKGDVDATSVDWKAFLGNAPEQPFDDYRMRNWRWFWDFGGGIFTDLMVHWVDVAQWVLDVKSPQRAVSIGQHVSSEGVWETPDTVQTLLTYGSGLQMHFEGTFANARGGAGITFMGTEASLQIDRGGYVLTPERGKSVEAKEMILGEGPRFADFYESPNGERLHLTNWIESIRSGASPSAPIEAGVESAQAAHLANEALRGTGIAQRST
jgi:predicted dehydrogenase